MSEGWKGWKGRSVSRTVLDWPAHQKFVQGNANILGLRIKTRRQTKLTNSLHLLYETHISEKCA